MTTKWLDLAALDADFEKWTDAGFGVPDFLDALTAFQPQRDRVNGLRHLVVFPMVTQNGSTSRLVEAVLLRAIAEAKDCRFKDDMRPRLMDMLDEEYRQHGRRFLN